MASLLDNLRPASFRGVAFRVVETDLAAGRRTQLHEYPQRDKPYAQDMGRASRMVRFQAFVVGKDYIAQAGKLLTALEAGGPGELIHPWFGTLRVSVLDPASAKFDQRLGRAEFFLSFVESGDLTYPSATADTAAASRSAASSLQAKAAAFFGAVAKFAGFLNRVVVQALSIYGTVRGIIANPLGFALSLLGYSTLPGNLVSLSALFGNPLDLGKNYGAMLSVAPIATRLTASATSPSAVDKTLIPIIGALVDAAGHPAMADPLGITSPAAPASANPVIPANIDPYVDPGVQAQYLSKSDAYTLASPLILALGGAIDLPSLPASTGGMTVAQQQQFANTAAIYGQTRQLLLVQAVGLSSLLACTVYDEVIGIRDRLCAALDREALAVSAGASLLDVARGASVAARLPLSVAAPGVANDLYIALTKARAAVFEDLTTRAQDSARLVNLKLPVPLPALAVAYDLYEDAARETEIIGRNHVWHPGFLPPVNLQVLSR